MRFHRGAGLPAGEAQRSGAGGWEWTLPETFSWYTPELGGLLLMLTGVGWTDRACIKCSVWSDRVFWRRKLSVTDGAQWLSLQTELHTRPVSFLVSGEALWKRIPEPRLYQRFVFLERASSCSSHWL